ncbi:MAG TPA: NHLP bacteriocin export ABC transporter permease/ATPase subunit [Lachnospiraceae bacterium]|nr:NHLP bacteriocin export ABC transporter permease/ATPase subunit [Lachnospiraceae bacterium]
MGWFDEQIRQAKKNDQDVFEEAILRMASVVLGKNAGEMNDSRIVTKETIDEILKYYHYKPVEIPDMITDPDEQLEYCLRPHGIMRRKVELKKGWYKDSYGPLMAFRNEDDMPVALFPKSVSGYWYKDPESGKHVTINKKNQGEFAEDAICFYRPLPLRKLDTSDLFVFMKSCFSVSDWVLLLAMAGVFTAVGMMMPYITRLLTGFVLRSGKNAILIGTAVFILSVIISKELVNAVYGLAVTRMQSKASLSIESAVMMRLLNLPAEFFRQYTAGELASRFQAITQLCQLMIGNVLSMGLTAVFSLAYMYQVFHYASGLLLPALLIILMTVVINLMAANKQQKVTAKVMEQQAKTSGISYALICGIQKVKLAGAEKRAFARWANEYAKQTDMNYNAPLLILISSALTRAVTLIGTIVLYYFAVKTNVEPSKYIAFNSAFGMITGAFASLAGVTLMVAQIKPIVDMIKPILSAEPESADNKMMVNTISGGIELSNVYFCYKENMPYVVDGMSLKIMPGEYIAIVGTTGCGKSTLMRLLLGFETPERGAIYYDGKDMSKLDLKSLRRRIGAVTQDGGLFQGSIYSNITISAPQLTQDEAWKAAEIAGIADDIRNMPMGMHSMISEGQGGISGGQKQRLMIARAIAPKPNLLMFDEATSALDNKTQKQVSEALDKMKCTRIVIAHRLSTIKNCDRILMLDKGKIIEDGTYDELIAMNGRFAELVERQRLDS